MFNCCENSRQKEVYYQKNLKQTTALPQRDKRAVSDEKLAGEKTTASPRKHNIYFFMSSFS